MNGQGDARNDSLLCGLVLRREAVEYRPRQHVASQPGDHAHAESLRQGSKLLLLAQRLKQAVGAYDNS